MNKLASKNSKQTKSIPKNMHQLLQQLNSKQTNNLTNKQTLMSLSQKPQKDYVKKFFERRLKIEMDVRNKIFLQAMTKNKGEGRACNHDCLGWQRKNEKDLNVIIKQSGLCINKISNSRFANRSESNQNLRSIRLTSKQNAPQPCPNAKKQMNKSENYEDLSNRDNAQKWKQINTNKFFRKERVHENLNVRSQTQKMRSDHKNIRDEYEYQFNPEHNRFVERGRIEQREEMKEFSFQKSIGKERSCRTRKTLLNQEIFKRTERSNGFKYEINESLREKLLQILQKQRGIKCRIQNCGNSSQFTSQQSHQNGMQLASNVSMQPTHELLGVLPSNLVTQKLKSFTENESRMESGEQVDCLAGEYLQYQKVTNWIKFEFGQNTEGFVGQVKGQGDVEESVHLDGSDFGNERKITIALNKEVKEKSLVICAICQSNIEEELWQHVQIFQHEEASESEEEDDNQSNKMLSIQSERRPMLLQCGHSFHKSCVLEWLKYKPLCPLCKTVLREQNSDDEDISLEFANEANSNYSYENTEQEQQQQESEQEILASPEHNFHSLFQFEPEFLNRSMNMSLNADSRVNIQISGSVTVFNSFSSSLDFIENRVGSHLEIDIENSSSSQSSFTFKSIRDSFGQNIIFCPETKEHWR